MKSNIKKHCLSIVTLLVFGFMAIGSTDTEEETKEVRSKVSNREDSVWDTGGSLHDKTALDWQDASNANKLATCADLLATAWINEKFKSKIQSSITSRESLRPYALKLVVCIDEATRAEPDSVLNRQMFSKQEVVSIAASCMVLMGWLIGSIDTEEETKEVRSKVSDSEDSVWHTGGSLHDKTALDWQEASNANKLATCADFLATAWMTEKFKSKIQSSITSMESLRPYALKLVVCIDEATRAEPDSVLNSQMFSKQEVVSIAASCMVLMGWLM